MPDDLDALLDAALPALAADPAPLQAERLASLIGAAPLESGAELADLAAILAPLEGRPGVASATVLTAMARLFGAPLGPMAREAAGRLAGAGFAPLPPPVFAPVAGFALESESTELLAVAVGVGDRVCSCSLIRQRGLEANLGGGIGELETEAAFAESIDALRREAPLQEPGVEAILARMHAAFAWAQERKVPIRAGLMLERPLFALLVTGAPDRWPALRAIAEREELFEELGPEAREALERRRRTAAERVARQRRRQARAARKRNRRG